jgi:hypothetical protein
VDAASPRGGDTVCNITSKTSDCRLRIGSEHAIGGGGSSLDREESTARVCYEMKYVEPIGTVRWKYGAVICYISVLLSLDSKYRDSPRSVDKWPRAKDRPAVEAGYRASQKTSL